MSDTASRAILDLPAQGWSTRPDRRLAAPVFTALTAVSVLTLCALSIFIAPRSSDYFWSVAVGHWIFSHSLFTTGHLSYAVTNHTIATEWLYDALLYKAYAVFGTAGTSALMVLLLLASAASTAWYLSKLGVALGRAVVGSLAMAAVLIPLIPQGRAMSVSFVLLPVLLALLHKSRTSPKWIFALLPLFTVWVNLHGSVLLGLACVALELIWSLVPSTSLPGLHSRNPHPGYATLALVSALAATCLTPWGPALALYDLKVTNNAAIGQFVTEWQSPNFQSILLLAIAAAVVLVLITAGHRRRAPALEATLTLLLLLGWLHSARALPYVALLTIVLACAVLPKMSSAMALRTAAFAAGASCSLLASVAYVLPIHVTPALSINASSPKRALAYLKNNHDTGRVLTTYNWSGYELFSGYSSFVDGRTDLFVNNGMLKAYENLSAPTANPDPTLTRYRVSYVIWPVKKALSTHLGADPSWRIIYSHAGVEIFARNSSTSSWPRGLITY